MGNEPDKENNTKPSQ